MKLCCSTWDDGCCCFFLVESLMIVRPPARVGHFSPAGPVCLADQGEKDGSTSPCSLASKPLTTWILDAFSRFIESITECQAICAQEDGLFFRKLR